MTETWNDITNLYSGLSKASQEKVREAAIACISHLPERCPDPKIFNVTCPEPMCGSLLPILETDQNEKLCTCRNYKLWVAWRENKPIVGLVSPVKHEEEV